MFKYARETPSNANAVNQTATPTPARVSMLTANPFTGSSRQYHGGLWTAMLCLWAGLLGSEQVMSAEVWSLGAYSLIKYEDDWKPALPLDKAKNPAEDFFAKMIASPGGAEPTRSVRVTSQYVTIHNVLPVWTGFGHPHWNAYRLVFFYGHNNSVPTPHPCGGDTVDMLSCDGLLKLCDDAWGTPAVPYPCYGCAPLTDGVLHPGALTYLYNRCTSCLLGDGYDFDGRGTGCYMAGCSTPTSFTYVSPGKLGYQLRWLILHGCQAVITATMHGAYNSTALRALAPTHGEWRIIMGHYKSYSVPSPTSKIANLDTFANALLAGQAMQAAYFDTDPDHNSSAIAAERMPFTWAGSTMANSRWSDEGTDAPGTKFYSQRWISSWPLHVVELPPPPAAPAGVRAPGAAAPDGGLPYPLDSPLNNANCTYALVPSSGFHGPGAETGTVSITTESQCTWAVVNTNSWIFLTSSANGVGQGTFSYAVAPNFGPQPRTGVILVESETFTVNQAGDPLTMGSVAIQNPITRQLLGTDTLPFRQLQTTYMPSNPVAPLILETVDQALCLARLQKVAELGFLDPQAAATPQLIGDLMLATNEQSAAWVSRSSGSYSVMRLRDNMITPTRFTNYLGPIQIALDYGVTNALIERREGEMVDLLSVSSVQCALATIDAPDTPSEQFRSDYYVVLGRRFQGVPVIGSEFVVRLDGNGQVAMVRKNWRRITQASQDQMSVSSNSLVTLMTQDPRFSEFYGGTNVDPAQITITDRRCGYMEAPVSYRQERLRVGGSLTFSVGPDRAEDMPQMSVSLEDNVTLPGLWGWLYERCRLAVQAYSANGCLLLLTAGTGYNYRIEASEDLANWVSCGVLDNVTNSVSFLDPQATGLTHRFYRAVELP